MWEKYLTDF